MEQRIFNNWKVFPNCDQSAYSLLLTESDRGRVCGIYVLCGCPREREGGADAPPPPIPPPNTTARPTSITAMITDHFSQLIPPFANPVRHNKDDNFVMYLGEDTAKAGVYPNLDAAYL